jgi:hypothetical protein
MASYRYKVSVATTQRERFARTQSLVTAQVHANYSTDETAANRLPRIWD